MKLINRYIFTQMIITFLITATVLIFIMIAAASVTGVELLAKGLSFDLFFKFILYGLPRALGLVIPLAVLIATILLFSRLSADNEITAMRASGISIWQITSPCLIFGVVLSIFCFWIQTSVAPVANLNVSRIKYTASSVNPRVLIEPGRAIEAFPGFVIYIENLSKIDDQTDLLDDVRLYSIDNKGITTKYFIAAKGKLENLPNEKQFLITLYDANSTIVSEDNKTDRIKGTTIFPLKYGEQLAKNSINRSAKTMVTEDIFARIKLDQENGVVTMPLYVMLNKRMALALSPFAFILMGIPFGIRTSRNETSVGLVVSLVLATLFYIFIIVAENLEKYPALHPDFLIWIPNIVYQIGGIIAIKKIEKRK